MAPELAEAVRRTPSPRLDNQPPLVVPCFRLMLSDGALFTEDGVPIPVVIVADLRVMADMQPAEAQRIGWISCVGLALDGMSNLTRHSFEQIGERQPTLEELSFLLGLGMSKQCRAPISGWKAWQSMPWWYSSLSHTS